MSLPLLLLGITLCIQRYKRQWFLTDTGSKNPYKLVYRVLKFAKDHTNPIRRSAFTYCEDELPSRLDLGKEKYGGPFTTEQVEDVKAFLGILRVLISLAPIMMVHFSIDGILGIFASHLDGKFLVVNVSELGFQVDTLTPLMITFLIPIYLFLLRPFIQNYIPGIFKRIGLGMIFILLSLLCTSVMDAYGHIHTNVTACFLHDDLFFDYDSRAVSLNINSYWLVIQYLLKAVGYMLLYIAVYEFICSQSPHAMKGLVIGTFFAIKGVFQLLGVVITYLPFGIGWKNIVLSFPSCGFVYYLINAIIALIGIVAYTCVARQYQYRVRDEPDNIYRYAEEYYANAQDEPNYDYDDYDNLDVHTIVSNN
jgi:peptide/histidine transporter 3/4